MKSAVLILWNKHLKVYLNLISSSLLIFGALIRFPKLLFCTKFPFWQISLTFSCSTNRKEINTVTAITHKNKLPWTLNSSPMYSNAVYRFRSISYFYILFILLPLWAETVSQTPPAGIQRVCGEERAVLLHSLTHLSPRWNPTLYTCTYRQVRQEAYSCL